MHGAALGGGAGLVAACDVPVAALGTQFGFTEVRLGIIPAVIAPYVVGKIGESASRELFLTGERFEAVRAAEIGLVRAAVPPEDLDAAVAGRVQELLQAGPRAIAEAKALIREVAWKRVEDVQRYTVERIKSMYGSGEHWLKFKKPIPVHLTYMNAYVDEHDKLVIREDIYGYDGRVQSAQRGQYIIRNTNVVNA